MSKIVLTQPNYSWLGKRVWTTSPYTLALLNACVDGKILDANFNNLSEHEVFAYFKSQQPDYVGVSSLSTEYLNETSLMTKIIKSACPDTKIVLGGIMPTVDIEHAIQDKNVDWWVMGEGEIRFPWLLERIFRHNDLREIDGLTYWNNGKIHITPPETSINDLDNMPFPDYGDVGVLEYGSKKLKFSQGLAARNFPYAVTITSRGCPYHCIFCSASYISGNKVRFRSAENVLAEVDILCKQGIKEIIFLDDHFLGNRKRVVAIMQGLIERKIAWKCVNLNISHLDSEIMKLMKESGCYQITVSIESGNQSVLDKIIKKPVKLDKVPNIIDMAKQLGFEVIANFVVGFPGETWGQIRDTFRFGENINANLVNFHIATPLPKTELMEICLKEGYVKDFDGESGYTRGVISTPEFEAIELEILRTFEWDRINFSSEKRKEVIARIQGISLSELEQWRKDTRRKVGVNVVR